MTPPKARRRLIAIWFVLAILVAGIVLHEATDIFNSQPPSPTGRIPVFQFRETDLGRVEVVYQGKSGAIMRQESGQWFLHDDTHSHHHQPASPQAHSAHAHDVDQEQSNTIAERMVLITRMLADRRLTPDQPLSQYGLDNPQVMVAFYGRRGKETDHTRPLDILYVGDLLPTQYAYYTKRADDRELALIPRYYIALLLALVFGEEHAPTPLPVLRKNN